MEEAPNLINICPTNPIQVLNLHGFFFEDCVRDLQMVIRPLVSTVLTKNYPVDLVLSVDSALMSVCLQMSTMFCMFPTMSLWLPAGFELLMFTGLGHWKWRSRRSLAKCSALLYLFFSLQVTFHLELEAWFTFSISFMKLMIMFG